MITINEKEYPMWSQFVERKNEWIGGILEDHGDSMDKHIFGGKLPIRTEITGVELIPNGKDSAFFRVVGKHFSCGFDTVIGGIDCGGELNEEGWIVFSGYTGHKWRISRQRNN